MKILESERLYLRNFTTGDIETMSRIYSDEEVMRYIGLGGPADLNQTKQMIDAFMKSYEENGFGLMAIIEKQTEKLIGHCGFNCLKVSNEIEIAYLLSKDCWGKGYATEIGKATLQYGFDVLKLDKIVALAYPQNKASVNVITKLGLKPMGTKEFFGIEFLFFEIVSSL